MTTTSLIGYVAAAGTTLAFVPQVVRILRTRSTEDISLSTFIVMTAGVFCWFVYGLLRHDRPMILANGITFVLSLAILVMKLTLRG